MRTKGFNKNLGEQMANIPAIELLEEFKERIDPADRNKVLLAILPIIAASLVAATAALVSSPRIAASICFVACMLAGALLWRMRAVNRAETTSQQLAHNLLGMTEDCIKLLDVEGRILFISDVGMALVEASPDDVLTGQDWLAFWEGPDARAAFSRARGGEAVTFSGPCNSLAGNLKWWTSTFAPVFGRNRKVVAVLCKSRDITAETSLINELSASAKLQRDMEGHVDAVFWSASPDFKQLHHVSSAFERMWEMPVAEIMKDNTIWSRRVEPCDLVELRVKMKQAVCSMAPTQSYFRLHLPEGRTRWVRADIYPVVEKDVVERVVSVCVDATSERERLMQLHAMAHFDSLTGLANRSSMAAALKAHCDNGQPFAFVFLDVDRFKAVNDIAGHSVGDKVLQAIASRIVGVLPTDNIVARAGGDEFTVIIPGLHEEHAVEHICQSLKDACLMPVRVGNQSISITYSIGVALFPEHGNTPEALYTSADLAMYSAKRAGRNTSQVYGESEQQELSRAFFEGELRDAVQRNLFVLHYQPQFDASTGAMLGFEALIRWQHPRSGLIPPNAFIPLLEESGLIVDTGHWVIRQAVADLRRFRESGMTHASMSVNVSGKQLADTRLILTLIDALEASNVDPRKLTLEITESALVDDFDGARNMLERIKAMGVKIAIDDFGTGYSSLGYLARFQPDILKLDKSFVDEIALSSASKTIAEAVISLAHQLNLSVTAEGVETQEQLKILRVAGCDEIQGFLWGRPVTFEQILTAYPFPVVDIEY
jgi:diguanylate cyclase (GGDEF)-like protein